MILCTILNFSTAEYPTAEFTREAPTMFWLLQPWAQQLVRNLGLITADGTPRLSVFRA